MSSQNFVKFFSFENKFGNCILHMTYQTTKLHSSHNVALAKLVPSAIAGRRKKSLEARD